MPGMDGRAFYEQLSHDQKLATIPIVVFSADEDIAREASAIGAVTYVQKPVDSVQLLTALRRCCP
jgi:CheY-like chemotaxis protein